MRFTLFAMLFLVLYFIGAPPSVWIALLVAGSAYLIWDTYRIYKNRQNESDAVQDV